MTFDERQTVFKKLKSLTYYILIIIISITAMTFIPMIGSEGGIEWAWPDTFVGWCIWITTRLGVAVINVLILYCFTAQGKVNIRDNENYIEAEALLKKHNKNQELAPRSPKTYFGRLWTRKGVIMFVSSVVSTMVLTEAILKFDLMNFLTYVFTVIIGAVFGYIQMLNVEQYWTSEYLAWAKIECSKEEFRNLQEQAKDDSENQPELTDVDCGKNIDEINEEVKIA